eukprot:229102-Amphidinium_carterae.1
MGRTTNVPPTILFHMAVKPGADLTVTVKDRTSLRKRAQPPCFPVLYLRMKSYAELMKDILSLLILGFDAIFIPLGAFGLPDYDFIVVSQSKLCQT